jgi:hypothetical protein
MSDVNNFYDVAAVSEASYVLFHKLSGDYSDDSIKDALQEKFKKQYNGRFSSTQAEEFTEHWQVVDHQANTDNGYSSTVFKSKTGSDFVLAFRGTELSDGGDLIADAQV